MNGRDNGHSDVKIGEKVLKKLLDSSIPFDVLSNISKCVQTEKNKLI
jgi:hypothetical protein